MTCWRILVKPPEGPVRACCGKITKMKKQSKVPTPRRELPVTYVPKLWEQADLRMASVRTIRSRYKEFVSDSNAVSVMKNSLCDRAAFLSVFIETLEVIAVETGELESGSYV